MGGVVVPAIVSARFGLPRAERMPVDYAGLYIAPPATTVGGGGGAIPTREDFSLDNPASSWVATCVPFVA